MKLLQIQWMENALSYKSTLFATMKKAELVPIYGGTWAVFLARHKLGNRMHGPSLFRWSNSFGASSTDYGCASGYIKKPALA